HYTPDELASYLARSLFAEADPPRSRPIRVLDPACGDGGLLLAMAQAAPASVRRRIVLVGIDSDPDAIAVAQTRLKGLGAQLSTRNFVADLTCGLDGDNQKFDLVIANPPYVRTQVLGATEARKLAARYGLSGRVDLYQAFIAAMASVVAPNGTLGLLTSNRFMYTQAGTSLRRLFAGSFDVRTVVDLGDTKLFSAAVLPAIVIARKGRQSSPARIRRVYEVRDPRIDFTLARQRDSIVSALSAGETGLVRVGDVAYNIESGVLTETGDTGAPWALTSTQIGAWLAKVYENTAGCFGDVGQVRVGIKTTADPVFIRKSWDDLPSDAQPEAALIHPLLTHRVAAKWIAQDGETRSVLYPHMVRDGVRAPIDLDRFPKARCYLEQHRAKLEGRRYVLDAGRKWFEIWVPQSPSDWAEPKIVWPDISEEPKFFFDSTGAIVNGDCYWIKSRNREPDNRSLKLMLGVANSAFALKFYDTVFTNRLYAGRRRFITQYVAKFPIPKESPATSKLITVVSRILEHGATAATEAEVDRLVWESFGIEEVTR
ncbi:Eco57I restriction-modification methylase domain-containing protein, partial [Archangium sp.]|uniref:Eco57I restriction-modification methylase domain-containing protein n=1 Tax=Archangium sp. TaxID=1872627 RepID=UPI002D69F37C